MISAILTPKRRGILAAAFVLFGAGIAHADEACKFWCGSGVCCIMDTNGLCGGRQCVHGCPADLTQWQDDFTVASLCTGEAT